MTGEPDAPRDDRFEHAWRELNGHLSWIQHHPALTAYLGLNIADVATRLIDLAYPGLIDRTDLRPPAERFPACRPAAPAADDEAGCAMPIGDKPGYANERFIMGSKLQARARANHGGQTLYRLAQRGGLIWSEALAIVENRQFRRVDAAEAERLVRAALTPAQA